jgi:hypothetical protein
MPLHFTRVDTPVNALEIWMACSGGYSFVISNESRTGPGLHGKPGLVASWRPVQVNTSAVKLGGSPFNTFAEAKEACEALLETLEQMNASQAPTIGTSPQ